MGLVLVLSTWAVGVATAQATTAYEYVEPYEIEAAVRCAVSGTTEGGTPELELTWACPVDGITMRLQNNSASSVSVFWDRSAYVDSNGLASNVMPGMTKFKDVGLSVPPSVVPAGAAIQEAVVPRSQVQGTKTERLLSVADVDRQVSVSLAVDMGGTPIGLTQRFDITLDRTALDQLEMDRRFEDQRGDLLSDRGTHQFNVALFGLGGVGAATLFGIMVPLSIAYDDDPDTKMTAGAWAVCGGLSAVALGVGIPLARKEYRALKEVDLQLGSLPDLR
jgi:hypothetical protein